MSVGDVNGKTKGSGARFNDGKIPIGLIPYQIIATDILRSSNRLPQAAIQISAVLDALGAFQMGGDEQDLFRAIKELDSPWEDCAMVFDYGRRKYSEWNWLRGMKWSIPLECAGRHLALGMAKGELLDPESGLSHAGHVMCNIVMLITYIKTFPEGDDRPKILPSVVVDKSDPLLIYQGDQLGCTKNKGDRHA